MFKNHLKDNITKNDMSNKFFEIILLQKYKTTDAHKFILSHRNEISKLYNFKVLTYFSFWFFSRPTSFLQKSSCRVSSEKNILNSSVEWSLVEWKNWIKVISLFTFSHIFCLLSILSYEARMIIDIHTCVIRKFQSLTYFFLFININTVTRGAHDIRTCVLWEFLTLTYCVV